ncbi:MAG TPA: ATP-grasp domain-containing protein [Candidatus Hydrogenedentes bacterium]|nr:ATP-grasp domain-containing protein [Candidatus Hydrogenedentota bacterium]
MKKLLVLGATPFQIPLVEKAHERGHYVITMDNVPDNPAHRHADASANVSTVDAEAVLAYAREHAVDGIITGGSDVGVPAVGLVCDHLGLSGVTHEQGLTATHKDLFRAFQRHHGLRHPEFRAFDARDDFLDTAAGLEGAYIIKPIDRSGSKGVTTIDFDAHPSVEFLASVFDHAYTQSITKRVILERFLDGVERGGDAFLRNGAFVCCCVTNKYLTPAPYFVPVGHTIPSKLDAGTRGAIQNALEETLNLLGIRNGPVNFDVMVGDAGTVTVLELSPRFGGNCIPQIIDHGAGFDEIGAAIDLTVDGVAPDRQARPHEDIVPTGSRILGSSRSGVLDSIAPLEAMRERYGSNLLELVYDIEPGEEVHQFTQGNYRIGHIIATRPSLEELEALLDDIERSIGATA